MFRFNKDVEYALISLMAMYKKEDEGLITARDIADSYSIPFKLLARILQKLRADGIITAVQGPRGGYRPALEPQQLPLGRLIRAVRGDEFIADCLSADKFCSRSEEGCIIRPIMTVIQEQWVDLIKGMTMDEFARLESRSLEKGGADGSRVRG